MFMFIVEWLHTNEPFYDGSTQSEWHQSRKMTYIRSLNVILRVLRVCY